MAKQLENIQLDHDAMMLEKFGHKVSQDGKLERRIVAGLVAHMETKGFRVTGVWDGEEWEKADTAKQAMEFIFNLDEASLRFVPAEGFDREKHESERVITNRGGNAYAPKEHGVFLVLGNGIDIISDWNYNKNDSDGFNAAMESFNAEDFE
jgi:hypothetical protein